MAVHLKRKHNIDVHKPAASSSSATAECAETSSGKPSAGAKPHTIGLAERFSTELSVMATRGVLYLEHCQRCPCEFLHLSFPSDEVVKSVIVKAASNDHLSRLNNAQFDRARTLRRSNKTIYIEIRKDPLLSGLDHSFVQKGCSGLARLKTCTVYFLCGSVCNWSRIWSSHFSHTHCKYRIQGYMHFILKVECRNDISLTGKWLISDTAVSIIW